MFNLIRYEMLALVIWSQYQVPLTPPVVPRVLSIVSQNETFKASIFGCPLLWECRYVRYVTTSHYFGNFKVIFPSSARLKILSQWNLRLIGISNIILTYIPTHAPCLNDISGQNELLTWRDLCSTENDFFSFKPPISSSTLKWNDITN